MKAYKFRSNLDYAEDILLRKRLYCAKWKDLNDPMEGMFAYTYAAGDEQAKVEAAVRAIQDAKSGLLVCSLSRTFDSHLLWAHYADGFRGLAIEVELPARDRRIRKVTYGGVFAAVKDLNLPTSEIARNVLFSKYKDWRYEKEVRILQDQPYFDLGTPVRRVIVGHRMASDRLERVREICAPLGIPVLRTGIGDEGIDADAIED